jgi:Domain of unknown function (DU1801)
MPKEESKDLKKFLLPYPKKIINLALSLREFVWDLYPNCNELIYDNYNAVAFGWSTSDKLGDTFCTIAAFSNFVHFGFYYGTKIADPEKRLEGKGSQFRYIKVAELKDLPKTYIKKLLKEAYNNSLAGLKDEKQLLKGVTIVKSISAKKRRAT